MGKGRSQSRGTGCLTESLPTSFASKQECHRSSEIHGTFSVDSGKPTPNQPMTLTEPASRLFQTPCRCSRPGNVSWSFVVPEFIQLLTAGPDQSAPYKPRAQPLEQDFDRAALQQIRQLPIAISERFHRHVHAFEHGDVEVGERDFLLVADMAANLYVSMLERMDVPVE